MTSYIQSFKQKFPDKITPEMQQAFHGGNSKLKEFTFEQMLEHTNDVSGIYFCSDENTARKDGVYVTKAMLKLNRIISVTAPPKRDDINYMLSGAPDKDSILEKFSDNPRDAFFKAIDHIIKCGNAYKCYISLSQEFYKGYPKEFAKNMVYINYDGLEIIDGKINNYIVFNPKSIQIVKQ